MYYAIIFILSIIQLIVALPTPELSTSLEPRCGSALLPDAFFLLQEDNPDAYTPVNNLFELSQAGGSGQSPIYPRTVSILISPQGKAASRHYLLVHFRTTPYGSYGCQLQWSIPAPASFITYYGLHQLDVKTTTGYYPPFRPTWNSIIAGPPSTLGTGVFGTVNAVEGASGTINTEACSNAPPPGELGGPWGLAFVFKFADWVEQGGSAAGVSFLADSVPGGGYRGPYLNYNC